MNRRRTAAALPFVASLFALGRVVLGITALGMSALSMTACASAGMGGASSGGSGGFSRRDERQFIGSFADVRAISVSRRYVFSATPSGIGIYDRLFNTWLPPFTRDNGFTDNQLTAFAADPVEDALWYGAPGAIVSYRPQIEQVQRTIIIGVPDLIAFDKSPVGDVYVRAGGQWTRVSRTGLASPASAPPAVSSLVLPRTLNDLYTQFPGLRAQQSLLFRDQRADRALRSYPVISGASSPERVGEAWLGTSGDGLYKVDPTFQQATPLRYGPIESGIGALALALDGVWAAGLGQLQQRAGLSFTNNDLQRWRWIDGTIAVPMLGMRAQVMTVRAQRAWIGTDRGLVRVRTDAGENIAVWTTLDGLPDDRIYSIAAVGDGAWVGTARGLAWVSDSSDARNSRTRGIGTQLLGNTSIYALQAIGDTLWIGTPAGLVALAGVSSGHTSASTLVRPLGADPALRRAVRALAWSDTVLLAATDDAVLRLTPRRATEPVRVPELDVRQVGQVVRVGIDDRTMWMAGSDGVVIVPRNGGTLRVLRVPNDLPAPPTDIVASKDWFWISTPVGIVRLRRMSDGGLP